MLSTLKKNITTRHLLLFFAALLFFSCQKDLSLEDGGTFVTGPDLSTKINSSVSGFVTDENDAAIMGATVQFGTSNITTDKYGYFEAKNVQVVKAAAVVTVTKPGYFKGIKTYMAKEGKAAFFRIKLIPKTIVGNINAASGGTITLANGLSIKLPAGGIVNAASNTSYTGTVNIAAFWINPTAADLNKIMPGDLRGINTEGSLKLLQTFGMVAVELTGASGELLQIVNGQKATLTLPIPSSLAASAPASIPLWYFDEAKGLWKQEGSAVKTGNIYTGDVSHFSFWDWGTPSSYVNFDCTIKDAAGNPVPFVWVIISMNSSPSGNRSGFTDASGYVSGPVPDNAQLQLDVYSTSTIICTPAHSQNFTTTSSNISLGNVIVAPNASWATVDGTITDCNNNAITNGYAIVKLNNRDYGRYNLDAAGHYFISYALCNTTSALIDIIAVDVNSQQESNNNTYTITGGTNTLSSIMACGNTIQEFINYTVNGSPYSFTNTPPQIWMYQGMDSINLNSMYLSANNSINLTSLQLSISDQNITMGSSQNLNVFQSTQTGQTTIAVPISVHITEYGNIGQFISGNFTGSVTGTAAPNNNYAITCNFRVMRTY
jgi:hypothetical protein